MCNIDTNIFCGCRNGRYLNDDEIAGMLIGLLLAGQHTSSTTSSWLGFFLAKHKDVQVITMRLVLLSVRQFDQLLSTIFLYKQKVVLYLYPLVMLL